MSDKIGFINDEIDGKLSSQINFLNHIDCNIVEFRSINKKNILLLSEKEIMSTSRHLKNNDIIVSNVASPIGKTIYESDQLFLSYIRKAIKACEILNSNSMRLFTYDVVENQGVSYNEIISRIEYINEIAKENGINILLENEKGTHLYNEFYLNEFIKLLFAKDSNIGILCDTGHMKKQKEYSLNLMKPYIKYLHIKGDILKDKNSYDISVKLIGDLIKQLNFIILEPRLNFSNDKQKHRVLIRIFHKVKSIVKGMQI